MQQRDQVWTSSLESQTERSGELETLVGSRRATPSGRASRGLGAEGRGLASWVCAAALLGVATALLSAAPRPVAAQDMVFTSEDTGQANLAPAAPSDGPPSAALSNGLGLYQQERYLESAVQFQRVVSGETDDAEANKQKAQFFLGKALYHLHYYQTALRVFDEITEGGPNHLYFGQTLQWLAQLASQLPESANIVARVGRYGTDQLEQFNTPQNAEIYYQLLYLMGRYKYDQREFEEAITLFGRVSRDSAYYVNAKFFEGVSHIQLRHASPAVDSFRGILEAIDRGARAVEDTERMRNLAWISLARVYYTAANRTDPTTGERAVDGRLLGNAVEAWNEVGQDSEYWLDALFEESWAFFLADEYARAMGNIHTLFSPYFDDAYYPEAIVLKAVVFFSACQWQNADSMVASFHTRYDPVAEQLNAILDRFQVEGGSYDNQAFFTYLRQVRSGQAQLTPAVRGVIGSALSDRTILRNLEYVQLLEDEERRLQQAPPEFRGSSLGARIIQEIAVAKSFAIDSTGDMTRARFDRLVNELNDLLTQIDTVELEIATAMREGLSTERAEDIGNIQRSAFEVRVDEEHQLWPFNGEYWRDELGYYRQQVSPQCTR